MVRTRFATPTIGREWMLDKIGTVVRAVDPDGVVSVDDAEWRARTNRATPVAAGEQVRVIAIDGVTLEVEPLEGAARTIASDHPDAPVPARSHSCHALLICPPTRPSHRLSTSRVRATTEHHDSPRSDPCGGRPVPRVAARWGDDFYPPVNGERRPERRLRRHAPRRCVPRARSAQSASTRRSPTASATASGEASPTPSDASSQAGVRDLRG